MADSKRLLTGVKAIRFTPWNTTDTAPGSDTINLIDVIEDTVALTQDDEEKSEIGAETRDEPIIESIKLGKYQITLDSGDINFDILEACAGFTKIGSTSPIAAAAPTSYAKKYVKVEIEMEGTTFLLPRVLLSSKIDASSLKTGIAKGTLSGTAYTASVTIDSQSAVDSPLVIYDNSTTHTIVIAQAS